MIALQTVGDEKGTQFLGYNWATLSLGEQKYGDLVFQIGSLTQG
jgi:hypothetical protein